MGKILIAEDEQRLAAFIEKGLRKEGFSVAIARDGEQALEMLESERFDLLLLDIGLPVKDGFAVLSELRNSKTAIPVIIVSAREDVQREIVEYGDRVKDLVTKPFRFEELLVRVQTYLSPATA